MDTNLESGLANLVTATVDFKFACYISLPPPPQITPRSYPLLFVSPGYQSNISSSDARLSRCSLFSMASFRIYPANTRPAFSQLGKCQTAFALANLKHPQVTNMTGHFVQDKGTSKPFAREGALT